MEFTKFLKNGEDLTLKKNQKTIEIGVWNINFQKWSHEERISRLYEIFSPEEILVTSSFGSSSPFLLKLISGICPQQEIQFIDTTYHFEETLTFRDQLIEKYNLNVKNIFPEEEDNKLTKEEQWWVTKPDSCCAVNKVKPLESLKNKYKIWISGIMGFQTPNRSNMNIFELQDDLIKFSPFIDLSEGEYLYWSSLYQLPQHPLSKLGFESIGCMPCTSRGKGRSGRWAGNAKIECGLHI